MRTFDIKYSSGEVVTVKPVPWAKLDDVCILQQNIIKCLLDSEGAVGSLLRPSNTEVWGYIKKLAALLPVVGVNEPGIDLNQIEELDEVVRIFVTLTEDYNEYGLLSPPTGEPLRPSLIGDIHSLNFYSLMLQARKELLSLNQNPSLESPNPVETLPQTP